MILSVAGLYGASGGFTTAFGWGLASLVAGKLMERPVKGPRLSDLGTQTSEPDQPIPWVYGKARIAGNIIWCSRKKEHESSEGGKGFGSKTTSYTYSESALILFCRGPIERFDGFQINAEKDLFWSYNGGDQGPFTMTEDGSTGVWNNEDGSFLFLTGTDTQLPLADIEAIEGAGNVPGYRKRACAFLRDLDLTPYGSEFPVITAWPVSPVTSVADILRDMAHACSKRMGFPIDTSDDVTDDIDVSAVRGDEVAGFVIPSLDEAVKKVEELGLIFGFDWVRRGNRLVVVKRGQASVRSIPLSELRVSRPGEAAPRRVATIASRLDLPWRVRLSYLNPNKKHRDDLAVSRPFPSAISRRVESLQVTAVLEPGEAERIANRALYEIWLRSRSRVEKLSWKHNDLTPCDVVTLETPLGQEDFCIETLTPELMGPIEAALFPNDPYIFTELEDGTGTDAETMNPATRGAPRTMIVDTVGLTSSAPDTVTAPGLILAGCRGAGVTTYGGLGMSVEHYEGDHWEEDHDFFLDGEAVMGELADDYDPAADTELSLTLYRGDLASTTEDMATKGANLAALNNGLLLTFETVTPDGDTWVLGGLRPGRATTDDLIGGVIPSGTRFVLLHDSENKAAPGVRFFNVRTALIGQEQVRVRSHDLRWTGDDVTSLRPLDGAYVARNMQEPSPIIEDASRDEDGGVVLSGRARNRYAEDSNDLDLSRMSAPQFAGQYKYRVSVTYDGATEIWDRFTTDPQGDFDFTISDDELSASFGVLPAADSLTVAIAIYGTFGIGRASTWEEAI